MKWLGELAGGTTWVDEMKAMEEGINVVNHLIHGNFKFLRKNLVLNSCARLHGQGGGQLRSCQ